MLFVTLRLLRGAKVLDFVGYGIEPLNVWTHIFIPVCLALDLSLDNVHFKADNEEWLRETSKYYFLISFIYLYNYYSQWAFHQMKKYGGVYTPGTICAGDGLLVPTGILYPKEYTDILKIPLDRFLNRKGFFGINCQALCESWCRFCIFESNWPSSVNDIIALKQTTYYF